MMVLLKKENLDFNASGCKFPSLGFAKQRMCSLLEGLWVTKPSDQSKAHIGSCSFSMPCCKSELEDCSRPQYIVQTKIKFCHRRPTTTSSSRARHTFLQRWGMIQQKTKKVFSQRYSAFRQRPYFLKRH